MRRQALGAQNQNIYFVKGVNLRFRCLDAIIIVTSLAFLALIFGWPIYGWLTS